MEIKVILNELENMNTEIHSYSELINQISSAFNTTCNELMSEIESELDKEINIAVNDTKKLSEKIFLALKRHENFILNTYNKYSDTEGERLLTADRLKSVSINHPSSITLLPTGYIPFKPFVGTLRIIDLFPLLWPDTNPVAPGNRKIGDIIIPGFFSKIINYDDISIHKAFVSAFVSIMPNAVIFFVNNLIPIAIGDFEPVIVDGVLNDENGGTGYIGNGNFEELVDAVGNAMRINYTLVRAWMATEIINYIIRVYTFIREMTNYHTLYEIIGNTNDDDKENTKYNAEDIEKIADKTDLDAGTTENGDSHSEIPTGAFINDDKNENNGKYKQEDINIGLASMFGGDNAAYGLGSHFANSDKLNEDDSVTVNDLSKNINETSLLKDKPTDNDNMNENDTGINYSSVGGGAVSFGRGSSGGGSYASSVTDPDIVEGNINVSDGFFSSNDSSSNYYSGKTKSDTSSAFNNTSDKASIIYSNIITSSDTDEALSVPFGAISAGAAGTAGAGTLGGLLFNSLNSNGVEDAIKCVAGAMAYTNLFDMVGKAERCSISWLGGIINILAK